MKFSVLMSLYIKEKPEYLQQCFESLQAQTRQADEIVLVIDGEITQALENVVQNFLTCLPLVILRLAENQGLGKALNYGLRQCKNEWVFRMDTDDICDPIRFAKQVAFIQTHHNVVVVGGQIAEFAHDMHNIVSYRYVPTRHDEIVKFTQTRCPFNHMTVAYQKSAVMEVGGYQGLQEDYSLWIKLIALNKPVANLDDILVYARVSNGMLGRRRGLAQVKAEWQIFKLKYRLGTQGILSGGTIFLLRTLPRLFPVSILQFLYKFIRK